MKRNRILLNSEVLYALRIVSVIQRVSKEYLVMAVHDNNNRIQKRNSRFFIISSLHHEPSPTRTLKWPGRNCVQITCNTLSAYRVQHVV